MRTTAILSLSMAPKSGLTEKSVGAAGWGLAGSALRICIQMGAQIALARILGPDQYGVFAIGVLVVTLSNYFADIGIAYGLVQAPQISDRDVRFVFTWQAVLGVVVASIIFFSAPLVASAFHEPRSAQLLEVLALVSLLGALTAPGVCLLKRELDFRSLQIAQVVSYVIGYLCVGIPMALSGAGVWSLAVAWLVMSIVQFGIVYWFTRHPLLPLLWYEGSARFLRFGGMVLVTNLVNWFMTNADKAIAGRFFPGIGMGLYSTSFTLLNTPSTVVYSNVQSVLFSAAARVQDEPDAIARAYLKVLGLLMGVFVPCFVAVSVASDTLVIALYGHSWADAGPLLAAFACSMPLLLAWGVSTPVLWNTGQASRESLIQLPVGIVWIAAAWFAAQHSLALLAWSMTCCFMIRVVLIVSIVARTIHLTIRDLASAVLGPICNALLVAGAVLVADRFVASADMPRLFVLLVDISAGALVLALTLRFFAFSMSHPARNLLTQAVRKVPVGPTGLMMKIAEGPK